MIVLKTSPFAGRDSSMEIPLSDVDYAMGLALWNNGRLIQEAFPTLTAEQREFIKTGLTPADWLKLEGDDA